MNKTANTGSNQLTPAQRLATQPRLCRAGIKTIQDMDTLRACVAYENANRQRCPVLEALNRRADVLRDQREESA
jgi:hypothetical protein